MHNIYFIASTVLILLTTAASAQDQKTKNQSTHDFRKFRFDFAGMGMRFAGKKEANVQGSKIGFGGFIQPAINLTDEHSVGLKVVWSYHDEDPKLNHISVLANYMFIWYDKNTKTERMNQFITFIGGTGVGITSGPGPNSNTTTHYYTTKTSLAIMPFAGIRYGLLFGDINYHIAAGNKINSFLGGSIGIMFNGGFRKK